MGLVGLTCLLTLVSAVALWMRALVLNTDSYVHAIGPVIDNPEVRQALAQTIVDTLYEHVDVAAQLERALPKTAADLAPTLAAGIQTTAVQLAAAALATPAARVAWRDANRIAHAQIVRELEGRGELVTTPAGEVAINTGPLAAAVLRALDSNGIRLFDAIPTSALDQQFVLFRSTALVRARHATHALDELAASLPIVTIAVAAGALVASTRRRPTVAHVALAIAGAMVLVCVGAAMGRSFYLAHVGAPYKTIAAAPFDALVRPLRLGAQITFAGALAVFVVVGLAGSEVAVAREERARVVMRAVVEKSARAFAIGGAVVAAVVLVTWDRPRPLVVVAMVAALGLWEVLCLTAARTGPSSGSSPDDASPDGGNGATAAD